MKHALGGVGSVCVSEDGRSEVILQHALKRKRMELSSHLQF